MASVDHLRGSARLVLATGLSPLLERRAQQEISELEKCGGSSNAKQSVAVTCPRCFTIWIPGITCKARVQHSKTSYSRSSGKNRRSRERRKRLLKQKYDHLEEKLGQKIGAKFENRSREELRYLHYECNSCTGSKLLSVFPVKDNRPLSVHSMQNSKSESSSKPSRKAPVVPKPPPSLGGLNLNDFLL